MKSAISLKDSELDFFQDHISINTIEEISAEIVLNNFKFEAVAKDHAQMKYRNLMYKHRQHLVVFLLKF